MMFEELTTQEIALVSGGDRWAGTSDGRAPCLATPALETGTTGATGSPGAIGGSQGDGGLAGAMAMVKTQNKSR
ncbi:hypothetical protein PV762_17475 [Mitsuaria sp. CC2]|uniref:hypothetical protein n=1 Tax=Mitsuaria sp. CC2 TaxID=3029186 RepID=UPI003B8D2865